MKPSSANVDYTGITSLRPPDEGKFVLKDND